MGKKKPLGFETPSMRIQEEYQELRKQIMVKEANWESILKRCDDTVNFAHLGVEDFIKKTEQEEETHETLMELEHRVLAVDNCITRLLVARVGKELAECDIRISDIEKELKELRRRL